MWRKEYGPYWYLVAKCMDHFIVQLNGQYQQDKEEMCIQTVSVCWRGIRTILVLWDLSYLATCCFYLYIMWRWKACWLLVQWAGTMDLPCISRQSSTGTLCMIGCTQLAWVHSMFRHCILKAWAGCCESARLLRPSMDRAQMKFVMGVSDSTCGYYSTWTIYRKSYLCLSFHFSNLGR